MTEPHSPAHRSASRTALAVAALRGLHQSIDGEPKILADPLSARLLGESMLHTAASYLGDPHASILRELRAHVVLRSRYCEDRLAAAVERGVSQFIVLGAGLDTFAYRQPAWAQGLRIYEVDHPASQEEKRQLLAQAGINIPDNVQFVAIDFEQTSLAQGLQAAGVDRARKSFFSCLGVMMYLSEVAVDALFALVAQFPVGSEIVFTYQQTGRDTEPEMASKVAALGEPWAHHSQPETLAHQLKALGFQGLEELAPADAQARYFQGRSDGLRAPLKWGIAAAVVGQARSDPGPHRNTP